MVLNQDFECSMDITVALVFYKPSVSYQGIHDAQLLLSAGVRNVLVKCHAKISIWANTSLDKTIDNPSGVTI